MLAKNTMSQLWPIGHWWHIKYDRDLIVDDYYRPRLAYLFVDEPFREFGIFQKPLYFLCLSYWV